MPSGAELTVCRAPVKISASLWQFSPKLPAGGARPESAVRLPGIRYMKKSIGKEWNNNRKFPKMTVFFFRGFLVPCYWTWYRCDSRVPNRARHSRISSVEGGHAFFAHTLPPSRRCGPSVGRCTSGSRQRSAPRRIARPAKRHA